jgi:hypothetical protein
MSGSKGIIYGLIAEFETPKLLVEAVRKTREAGYYNIEIYTPFPIEELEEAPGLRWNWLSFSTLVGGCIGGGLIYFIQYFAAVVNYPINVGGRPYHSWPAFIPITVEVGILGAALGAVISMLVLNGLPRLTHPVFNVPAFDLATRNRFFLCIRANNPCFDITEAKHFLESLEGANVHEVEE